MYVFPSILFLLCDQPARRSLTGLLAGNSNLHPCFGTSISVKNIGKPFKACDICIDLLRSMKNPTSCEHCCCWGLPSSQTINHKYESPIINNLISNIPTLHKMNTEPCLLDVHLLQQVWDECFLDLIVDKKNHFCETKIRFNLCK